MNRLQLNPSKMEVLLVGSNSIMGSGCRLRLTGVALTPESSVSNLGVL